jgi:hypothetical protein
MLWAQLISPQPANELLREVPVKAITDDLIASAIIMVVNR